MALFFCARDGYYMTLKVWAKPPFKIVRIWPKFLPFRALFCSNSKSKTLANRKERQEREGKSKDCFVLCFS